MTYKRATLHVAHGAKPWGRPKEHIEPYEREGCRRAATILLIFQKIIAAPVSLDQQIAHGIHHLYNLCAPSRPGFSRTQTNLAPSKSMPERGKRNLLSFSLSLSGENLLTRSRSLCLRPDDGRRGRRDAGKLPSDSCSSSSSNSSQPTPRARQ